jgi:TonB family protein
MKMFKTKYFAASLIIHSAVISYFIIKNSTEKAETSMLITEVIKVIETSRLNDSKKENIPIKKFKEKENLKINKQRELSFPNPESITEKSNFTEINLNDIKKNSIINKSKGNVTPLDKKVNYKKTNKDKELSQALYKIGSINNPHPPYPIIARKKGIEGSLILSVSVNKDGSVGNVIIKKSSGHKILDKVSKETIEKWLFVPAKRMGQTIKDDIQVPIKFVLTE